MAGSYAGQCCLELDYQKHLFVSRVFANIHWRLQSTGDSRIWSHIPDEKRLPLSLAFSLLTRRDVTQKIAIEDPRFARGPLPAHLCTAHPQPSLPMKIRFDKLATNCMSKPCLLMEMLRDS